MSTTFQEDSVEDLFDRAKRLARRLGRGKIHEDDCDSIAGEAVAMKMAEVSEVPIGPRISRTVATLIWKEKAKNARYEHASEEWWGERVARAVVVPISDYDEETVQVVALWTDGDSPAQIEAKLPHLKPWRVYAILRALKDGLKEVA